MKHKFFYNVNEEKKLPTHGQEWLKSLFHLDSGTKQREKISLNAEISGKIGLSFIRLHCLKFKTKV